MSIIQRALRTKHPCPQKALYDPAWFSWQSTLKQKNKATTGFFRRTYLRLGGSALKIWASVRDVMWYDGANDSKVNAMFRNSPRGTLIWLFIVGVVLGFTMMAEEVPNGVSAALLAAYLALVVGVARNIQVGNILKMLSARGEKQSEPTEIAREATARARAHPDYDSLIHLLDVGLIVDEHRPDGVSLRRGRFISLDDDSVRPFAIIHMPPALSGRLGRVRFEIRDETGQLHYVYEDEKWLQAGENILLPDYRFPIQKKADQLQAGSWSTHVRIDEGLLGIHHFNLSPSLAARRRLMGTDGEIMRERVWRTEDDDESLPLSLEELLRQQSRQHHQS